MKEHELSQYADDGIILVSDVKSIELSLNTVKLFSNVAGPQLNMEKVQGMWLGALKDNMTCNYAGVKWTSDVVKCLGIYIGNDMIQCKEKNWETS